ncbi:hypothetical protein D9757_012295 [Collybiopsis confluens]|uniref:Bulb-type lectin domain-containing protein n=1 Tax=Collybiopsis confluens TaxID=2823264 RepID=A0A8H5G5R0_9AGAR|nr:hypothetical protein D9757_012295 [Collybiopsis confluens]
MGLRTFPSELLLRSEDGDLQLVDDAGAVLWAVNGQNIVFVRMQVDGNCVGYNATGAVWAMQTNGINSPYHLICQDNGTLVITANGNPVWNN